MSRVDERAGATHGRIDEVDALRTFAMTAVIAQHCRILPFGWMGVWLFFVISGFVVTTSLERRPSSSAAETLIGFYTRRAARIIPIYFAYVMIGFIVSALSVGRPAWASLASLIFFYNNIQTAFANGVFVGFPVGHLWTISVEMQFYLLFGFAFALLPRRALAAALIGFLIASPVLRLLGSEWLKAAHVAPLRAAYAIYVLPPLHFDSFAAGALLALGAARWRQSPRAHGLLLAGALAMTAYAGAFTLVNVAQHRHGLGALKNVISGILFGDGRQVFVYSAVALLSTGVLAVTLAGRAPWAPITRNPVVQAVGRASYGGYVYHAICVFELRPLLRAALPMGTGLLAKLGFGLALFTCALPATVVLSLISYRFLERPIIAAANRWLGARRRAGTGVPSPETILAPRTSSARAPEV